MQRIAILISGRGTNMEHLVNRAIAGDFPASVVFVGSDNPEAKGLEKARLLGIETKCYPYRDRERKACEEALIKDIEAAHIDWVILAGFMKILSPHFVSRFKGKIVNIHPSLLPAFPGTAAIEQAWRHGVRITGVTVHLVDEQVDHGTILSQEAIPVSPGDSLESLETKIHEVEHQLYWKTLRDLFNDGSSTSERRHES